MTEHGKRKLNWRRLLGFEQISDQASAERIGGKAGDKGNSPPCAANLTDKVKP